MHLSSRNIDGRRRIFAVLGILLGFLLGLLLAMCILLGYLRWARANRRPVPRLLRRFALVQLLVLDENAIALVEAIRKDRKERFSTTWDLDSQVLLSQSLFRETEMYGQMKYRYKPDILVFNTVIWTGLEALLLTFPAFAEAERLLGKCDVLHLASFRTDEYGFKASVQPALADCPRVFFLGDSFTEGLWLPAEFTFASEYGRLAAAKGQPCAPVNLGVNGYGVLESCWMLEHYAPKLGPVLAVYNLFPNDIYRDYLQVTRDTDVPEANYDEFFAYLDRAHGVCSRQGIPFVVSAIPCKEQFTDPAATGAFQDRVRTACEKRGIRFLDPRECFRRADPHNVYLSWDAHFSEDGHRIYARFLFEHTADCLSAGKVSNQ